MDTRFTTLRRRALQVACSALVLLAALPVAAASPEIVPSGGGLAVDLAGHRVTLPPPVWSKPGAEPVEQAKTIHTDVAAGVESLVLLPVGATAVTWTELMGVLVVNHPGYTATKQLASVVDPITGACADDELYATTFGGGDRGAVLLLCGRYKLNAPGVPHRCSGGVILATVLQSGMGAAKVYHEWCTAAFDVTDRATWPVPADDLAGYAEVLMAISDLAPQALSPAAGN